MEIVTRHDGHPTTDERNDAYFGWRRIDRLAATHAVEELRARVGELTARVAEYEERYGSPSPAAVDAVAGEDGHVALHVVLAPSYYPESVDDARLTVRWYTNDDFAIHHREDHADHTWECRWDRHPNPHSTRDHFRPPPAASTPGDDASWPDDYRDVVTVVLDEVDDRVAALWSE